MFLTEDTWTPLSYGTLLEKHGLLLASTMVSRGIDVKEPLCADSLCWHIDWAQFNLSQQTARQGVTWDLRKPVPG